MWERNRGFGQLIILLWLIHLKLLLPLRIKENFLTRCPSNANASVISCGWLSPLLDDLMHCSFSIRMKSSGYSLRRERKREGDLVLTPYSFDRISHTYQTTKQHQPTYKPYKRSNMCKPPMCASIINSWLCLTVYRCDWSNNASSDTHENSVDVHGTLRADENRSKRNGHLESVYMCLLQERRMHMIHPHLESLSHVNKISRFNLWLSNNNPTNHKRLECLATFSYTNSWSVHGYYI